MHAKDLYERLSAGYNYDPMYGELCNERDRLKKENAKLRELVLGLKWCSENYGCKNLCPLYDKSEPEHCREERFLRELRIGVKE